MKIPYTTQEHHSQNKLTQENKLNGEIKKMTNETKPKEHESAQDVEIEVTSVEVQKSKYSEHEAVKVIFETNKGRITYKPTSAKIEMMDGLKIRSESPTLLADLPQNLKDISIGVNAHGTAKVLASYMVWNTDKDGSKTQIRYVQGAGMFEKWKLIPQTTPTPQEKVQ